MAEWTYSTSDPLTNHRWAKQMWAQTLQEANLARLISKEPTGVIIQQDDFQKHAGDQVTYGVSQLLQAPGVMDLQTLTGNEESPVTYGQSLYIHELAHAILIVGPISNQRILFDTRKVGAARLSDWYAARLDHAGFNQLGSAVSIALTQYTGLQAPTAATRVVRQGNPPTYNTGDSASLGNPVYAITLTLTDFTMNQAKSLVTGIRPVKVQGRSFYIQIMHSTQASDLRTNTSIGQWLDIQKAAMTGGDLDSPIFWQSHGMYRGTLYHENQRIPNAMANAGTAVTNTKRALFIGAQAATAAWGRAQGEVNKFVYLEEVRDFARQIGIGVSSIWGLVKAQFNSADFSVVAIDTYGLDVDTFGTAGQMAM
jgi:N4-gp56 family major capsid protein